jgi:hypothetical protein
MVLVLTYRRGHSVAAAGCGISAARLSTLRSSTVGSAAVTLASAVATSTVGGSVDSAHEGHHRQRVSHRVLSERCRVRVEDDY